MTGLRHREAPRKHVCVVYDCLFPWTVGGAERWYRRLAESYAAKGYKVTYLTMRQWTAANQPDLKGVEVIPVGPAMPLYAGGKRRILPPLAFGLGVFAHLVRHGRCYDLLHTASFPFFSLLAAGLLRPFCGFRLVVDWHEVWTRAYWRDYLGVFGPIGWLVQWLCAGFRQTAFSFSRLHAERAEQLAGQRVAVLTGEYDGPALPKAEAPAQPPRIVYAGRMIPEKRVLPLVEALAVAMEHDPSLQATLIGRGPDLAAVEARIAALGLSERIATPGFVAEDALEQAMRTATAIVQPSAREGYGMVVVEAAARGVPCLVVAGEDNAATELVEPGRNGVIAPDASPAALANAIRAIVADADALRRSTGEWYAANAERLSFAGSFRRILAELALD